MIAPVAIGLGVAATLENLSIRRSRWAGPAVAGALVAPLWAAAAGFLAFSIGRFRRAARRDRAFRARHEACFEASELVALGLAGGLSVAAAHQVALEHAAVEAVGPLEQLVGSIRSSGTRAALAGDAGPMMAASRVLAAAAVSGAPALPALEGHLEAEAHRRHAERVEAARRLPVRLLLPLTLLVLPGFVLLTVGPTVVGSLARLSP